MRNKRTVNSKVFNILGRVLWILLKRFLGNFVSKKSVINDQDYKSKFYRMFCLTYTWGFGSYLIAVDSHWVLWSILYSSYTELRIDEHKKCTIFLSVERDRPVTETFLLQGSFVYYTIIYIDVQQDRTKYTSRPRVYIHTARVQSVFYYMCSIFGSGITVRPTTIHHRTRAYLMNCVLLRLYTLIAFITYECTE